MELGQGRRGPVGCYICNRTWKLAVQTADFGLVSLATPHSTLLFCISGFALRATLSACIMHRLVRTVNIPVQEINATYRIVASTKSLTC